MEDEGPGAKCLEMRLCSQSVSRLTGVPPNGLGEHDSRRAPSHVYRHMRYYLWSIEAASRARIVTAHTNADILGYI